MVSRPTLARIAVGILLGVVLGVVLNESNTRKLPLSLRGVVANACYIDNVGSGGCPPDSTPIGNGCYVNGPCTCPDGSPGTCGAGSCVNCVGSSAPSCNGAGVNCGDGSGCCPGLDCNPSNDTCEPMSSSSEPWYICACGACVSSGFGTPGEWGNATHDPMCDSTCGDQMGWPQECFPSSSSSSQPQYCCSGAGICEQVYLGLTTCIGAETTDSTCGGGCSSSSSVTIYCCNQLTHSCEVSSSSVPSCVAGGACDCSTCVENCAPGECPGT